MQGVDSPAPLTHWDRDTMAAIFQTTFQMQFLEWRYRNFIKISLKFVSKGPINNIPALGTNDDKFTDAYMRHSASMS